ncbi:ABC transporter permease [Bacillus sp. DNRA2]|uniref:ABC transporter permease n=1 Tax=Bacillus sp. DNRA2 TaxID=2723053 RepID=UPI00145D9B82|nr:ABC transporter permease [Bacillus sp. DNRA2]NMD70822.1 ABC transporter permease [Bacillus sp. DNRA2]
MHRILAILMLHLKEFAKSPASWVLMILMPVVFSFIFGGMAMNSETAKPVVNIVANDDVVSTEVVKLLKQNDQYQWEMVTETKAKNNVLEQEAIAAVVIPANLKQRLADRNALFDTILQRKSEQYMGLEPFINGTAQLLVRTYQVTGEIKSEDFAKVLSAINSTAKINVEKKILQKNDETKDAVNLMFVGFAIMFMMFGLTGAASTILDEKLGGTWARLFISPATKLEISVGYLVSYFLMGWIQFAVLMLAMNLMFDIKWSHLEYLIPFASLVILCVVGFGLMIAGLVKTKQQAMALSAVVITSTCMLGGVYWSLDLVPEFMKKISLAVPQSWAMAGFEEIISGSLHTGTLITDTLVLFGFSIVFFSIGLRLIKYD